MTTRALAPAQFGALEWSERIDVKEDCCTSSITAEGLVRQATVRADCHGENAYAISTDEVRP